MAELISLTQLFTLLGIHLAFAIGLFACAYVLLPKGFRAPVALLLLGIFGWSAIAVLLLYVQKEGFLGWLFNPSGEKNFAALLNTTLLMLIAMSSMSLAWASYKKRNYWQIAYWVLVASLFIFLAIDEYFSVHESIVFWRGAYLILGGTVGLISLLVIGRSESNIRWMLLMFIIGLGIMGVSGVVLDAFSSESLLDIGPIKLGFISCQGEFLGVECREFGNTEEMMELFGAGIMWLSLTAMTYEVWAKHELGSQRRLIYGISIGWLLGLIAWMWIAPEIQLGFAEPADTTYGDIVLLAYDLDTTTIQGGDRLNLTLYLQTNHNTDSDYSMSVHLYTQDSSEIISIAQDDMELGDFNYPTQAWLPKIAVRNHFQLDIPDDLVLNQSYQLVAILWEGSIRQRIPIQETIFSVYDDGTTLVIDGIAAPDTLEPPETDSPRYEFAAGFSLLDVILPNQVTIGESVSFEFLWDVNSDQDIAASQFMHWFNVDTEEFIIFDQIPFAGMFPTQDWVSGMLVRDTWIISLPDDIAAGQYRIQTGLFETVSANRLAVRDTDGMPVQDNSIVLGEITVQR